jgi:proton-coupled amino acid transporter
VHSFVPNLVPLFVEPNEEEFFSRDLEMTRSRSQLMIEEESDVTTEADSSSDSSSWLAPGSIPSSILNLTTATLGVGTLSIPSAFYNAGLVISLLFLLLQAFLSVASIKQIILSINATEKPSFEEVTMLLFGKGTTILFELSVLGFCFGSAIAYHITIADIGLAVMEKFLGDFSSNYLVSSFLLTRSGFLIVVTSLILLPLSLSDKLAELRYTCLIGVLCVVGLVLIVLIQLCVQGIDPLLDFDSFLWPRNLQGAVGAVGIFTFALCSQPNVPSIFSELDNRSIHRMGSAVNKAVLLCVTVYTTIGIAGVLQWGPMTASSAIINLEPAFFQDDVLVIVAYAAMMFSVCMSYPLNIYPIKITCEQILMEMGSRNVSMWTRIVAIITVALSLLCAVWIPKVSVVFDIIGTTAGCLICFILPASLYLKMLSLGGGLFCRRARKAWVVLVCGCIFFSLGVMSYFGLIR